MALMDISNRSTIGRVAVTALAFSLIAGGCITPGSQHVKLGAEQLQASSRAVTSLAEVEYVLATMEGPVKFSLDEHSMHVVKDGRRRFIKGFRLPAWPGSYSLSISSYRLGTPSDPAVLYPEVRLLDDQFAEIRVLEPSAYSLRALPSGEAITATMFINNHDRGEKYLVVSERDIDDAALEKTQQNMTGRMPVSVYGRGAVFTWMIPTGVSSPPVQMLASPVGRLEVVFELYRPKKVGE